MLSGEAVTEDRASFYIPQEIKLFIGPYSQRWRKARVRQSKGSEPQFHQNLNTDGYNNKNQPIFGNLERNAAAPIEGTVVGMVRNYIPAILYFYKSILNHKFKK